MNKVIVASETRSTENNQVELVVETREVSSNELKKSHQLQVIEGIADYFKHTRLIPGIGTLEVVAQKAETEGDAYEVSVRINEGIRSKIILREGTDTHFHKVEDTEIPVHANGNIEFPTIDATPE